MWLLAILACAKSPGAIRPEAPPSNRIGAPPEPSVDAPVLGSGGLGEACGRPMGMFGPVVVADPGGRTGEGVTALAEVSTSMERPVEVCGLSGELGWLMAARCADGSAPFDDPAVAHAARVGSTGGGGRCGSILDLYVVPCPEGGHEVYMDMYVCGQGEPFK